ncbi:phospholipase/carboxylesterase [Mariprofundus aestuarium]|uniref:Phospholipase/carboxylesterase n=1 Tax=Mariprofundus aestuarium TaxID=1921086 RepID=A0A2K8KYA7_MARES|nr:dienelactone hydrolase family protein [Mariprofundus aestuarium]ATX78869.1 phospholipase/carboxylesterase [Mariprofundus aestuarium]
MILHTLPHITVETGPKPTATIIWLHGLGADGHDFEPIVPQLGLPADLAVRFIFPHAPSMPVTLNGGYIMPAWYDIKQTDLGIEHDKSGIKASASDIQLLIEKEQMRGIKANRIILAGFSQGAAMSLHIGLRQESALAGIMSLSGYLLLPDQMAQFKPAALNTPIFMAHGINDPVVPYALGDKTRRKLVDAGCPVEWHSYPMQHSVCAEEIRHIGKWITSTFSAD